jgi:ectoine hydroxylase-related dioxygenase (phytanoyl-CoA dioxygenase family)
MRQVFSDPILQEQFERDGYVVVPALNAEQIQALQTGYDTLVDPQPTAFESTMNSTSPAHKRQAHEIIVGQVADTAQRYLQNYKPILGNFVRKQASESSAVPPHQDWTMVDEDKYSAVNIWIPLVDVNEHNGAIYLLKGGHAFPTFIRGNYINPAYDWNLFADYHKLTPVFMQAGEALIYHPRCIHASPPNKSLKPRLAAGMACIPQEATPLHYHYNPEQQVLNCYEADIDFYAHYAFGRNTIPEHAKLLSSIEGYVPPQIPLNIQQQILEAQHPKIMIFKTQEHQAQYEQDGYILIDNFLSETEIAELIAKYESSTSWFKDGFMSSIYIPQEGYKEQVDAWLEPFAKRAADDYMIDYEPIVGMFMVKGAGESSAMYPHQDWTLVDENYYASFNIWIPLVDIDHHNGAMSIMKGGHKLPLTYRGSCVPDALADKEAFMPDKLTYMPMKAGQALIYDHRCIHVSPPNQSDAVRPACAIGLVPKHAEIFHYYYHKDQNLLQRYKADKAFYFGHVIAQFDPPQNATLLDEQHVTAFYMFSSEDLDPVFAVQEPRKVPVAVQEESPAPASGGTQAVHQSFWARVRAKFFSK